MSARLATSPLTESGNVTHVTTTSGQRRWETGATEAHITRGVFVTGPDPTLFTFLNHTQVGACVGAAGSDALSGCTR